MDNVNIKKIKPVFNSILVTAEKYELPNNMVGKIITTDHLQLGYKPIQTVVAVGSVVTCVQPGEKVYLDYNKYAIYKQKQDTLSVKEDMDEHYHRQLVGYRLEPIVLDGVEHLLLFDRDIQFIVEDMEEIKQSSLIIQTPILNI